MKKNKEFWPFSERVRQEAARLSDNDKATLTIGYLRCYSGQEFHLVLEEFSSKYPDVLVKIKYGNHEELYGLLRTGGQFLPFYQANPSLSGDSQIKRNDCAFWKKDNFGLWRLHILWI